MSVGIHHLETMNCCKNISGKVNLGIFFSFFANSQQDRKCLSDERMKQDPFASRTLPAPLSHMLRKLLPRANLILGHKHPGGCGRTKFTKK